jgi:hypothetical protein
MCPAIEGGVNELSLALRGDLHHSSITCSLPSCVHVLLFLACFTVLNLSVVR